MMIQAATVNEDRIASPGQANCRPAVQTGPEAKQATNLRGTEASRNPLSSLVGAGVAYGHYRRQLEPRTWQSL